MTHIFDAKHWRLLALVLFLAFGGIVFAAINWIAGFTYAGNSPFSIVAHIVGTMLWGASCAVAVRWSKL